MNCRNSSTAAKFRRRGTSSLDAITAFTLIVAVISVATPLAVRHGRLLKSQHNYRLALDELTNQMERLTTLPTAELPKAVAELKPTEFISTRLPGAEIRAVLEPADRSTRVTLSMTWRDTERNKAPLSLAGWAFDRTPPSGAGEGGQP